MLKKFLGRDLSAAGIPHVVKEKSALRRCLWIVALLAISAWMMSMTYKVLQEYLEYPTVMHTRRLSLTEMEFPAVTVCGYSIIPRHNYKEAELHHIEDVPKLLATVRRYNVSMYERVRCLKDPLCKWSRFLDECNCYKKACFSTECYTHPRNTFLCSCSKSLCLDGLGEISKGCYKTIEEGREACVCRTSFEYSLYKEKNDSLSPSFLEAVERLDASPDVKNILKALKSSNLTNLRDVEKYLLPNIAVRDNYGMSYEDLVLSCTFGSQPCNQTYDVSTLYSPSFGKCYSFNYAGEEDVESKLKVVQHAGKTHGLRLLIKSPKDDIFPLLSSHYGARVIIHEPRSLPFASENGFDVNTGDSTSIMLRYAQVNRLGPPWNDCAIDGDNVTSSYLAKPYSQIGCIRSCLDEQVFKRCGCHYEKLFSGTMIPIRKNVCGPNQVNCTHQVFRDRTDKKFECRCPPPCSEKRYDAVSFSASKMNREFYRLIKMVQTLKMVDEKPAVAEPQYRQGMFAIHVYLGSFSVLNITEKSMYSWQFLVANIGGNMGLFLGLSLITFVEIAEFLLDIVLKTFFSRRTKKRRYPATY